MPPTPMMILELKGPEILEHKQQSNLAQFWAWVSEKMEEALRVLPQASA